MIRGGYHKVLGLLMLSSILGLSSGDPSTTHVSTNLYGSVTLPCTSRQSSQNVTVIWEKEKNIPQQIVYSIVEGKENLTDQDPRYRGRVELSPDSPQGNLSLKLRNVTYEDEGTYYCRSDNNNSNSTGDHNVTLSIDGLEADNPILTLGTIHGKPGLMCLSSGVFRNPQVQWITTQGEDLSRYTRLHVLQQNDGRMLVLSVLEYPVENKTGVWCNIMEGRLDKSANVTIPDDWERMRSNVKQNTIISAVALTLVLILIMFHLIVICGVIIIYRCFSIPFRRLHDALTNLAKIDPDKLTGDEEHKMESHSQES